MKILVTGAAGFVGSHLAEQLAELNHDVIGLDCLTDYYAPALKQLNVEDLQAKGIIVHKLDLASDDLTPILAGVELIYHLAAQPGISATTSFETYLRNNLTATYRLLEASKRLPSLKCLVNISTSSVYGKHATDSEDTPPKPTSYYGVTKLAAEQLALAYQRERRLPVCSLRLFSVYGPRERPEKLYPQLIRSIMEDRPFTLYEGSEAHSRSYTFIADIVSGLTAVVDHLDQVGGEIINIGSDIEVTTGEGIRIVEQLLGRPARKVIKPKRPGDQLQTHANIDKARRLLGYNPTTRLEEGLAAEVAWFKARLNLLKK
jgi:nucleoside-diphosphate-sugar epimerase